MLRYVIHGSHGRPESTPRFRTPHLRPETSRPEFRRRSTSGTSGDSGSDPTDSNPENECRREPEVLHTRPLATLSPLYRFCSPPVRPRHVEGPQPPPRTGHRQVLLRGSRTTPEPSITRCWGIRKYSTPTRQRRVPSLQHKRLRGTSGLRDGRSVCLRNVSTTVVTPRRT